MATTPRPTTGATESILQNGRSLVSSSGTGTGGGGAGTGGAIELSVATSASKPGRSEGSARMHALMSAATPTGHPVAASGGSCSVNPLYATSWATRIGLIDPNGMLSNAASSQTTTP